MNDDEFFDRVGIDARQLRYEADVFMTMRISVRVRERITAPPTVSLFLARWLRPVAASLSAIALASCVTVVLVERSSSDASSLEAFAASNSMEISMAGDVYRVGE
jgi:hypothetical protein